MSSQGFKNLIKITLFADDSFQPLLKKSDDYRKITQTSIDHFQMIVKNYENFEVLVTKYLKDYEQEIEQSELNLPQYYYEYIQLYRNIHSEQKSLTEKYTNNFKELTSLCNNIFSNYSNLILDFQTIIRSYKAHEQILMELSKKYFRSHKTMIANMDYYKNSFTDVKLIYNMDQKSKRYIVCEQNHRSLLEELQAIEDKLGQLNQEKIQIIAAYKEIQRQFKITIKSIGMKQITLSKSFLFDFCHMQKIMITYLAQKKFTLEKIQLKTFLSSETKIKENDYFNVEIDRKKCEYCPSIIIYHKEFKEEYFPYIGKILNVFLREIEEKIEKRKYLNKKILEFTNNYIKGYEKCYYSSLKDTINNFQKIKKKIEQVYGKRLFSFLKSNNSIFEISIGINEKFMKRTPPKVKLIQSLILEQTKMLDLFMKQFKANVDGFLKKKEIKKLMQNEKDNEFTEEEYSAIDINNFKAQLAQKAQYLQILINGFVQKFKKNQDSLKFQYNAFVNDFSVTINEFYSLTCQYKELYFGQQDYAVNYKKYEADIDKTLENQSKFFQDINFGALLKDSTDKIVFQSEIQKIQEFKKIKKPMQISIQKAEENVVSKEDLKSTKKEDRDGGMQMKQSILITDSQKKQPQLRRMTTEISNNSMITSQKKQSKQKNMQKYEQFLASKIVFLSDEKFYNSYSCGLSDKIILTGRLYITNKRLCFHSKFNPNNVFFGDTFMQIPRKDILKIEKRLNAIIFDNSISITTINGEVFLTSFFARNEAYDTICKAIQINNDEFIFEPEELKQEQLQSLQEIQPEQDDIKPDQLKDRQEKIERLIMVFPYKELHKCEFSYPNFNALRYFKMFQDAMELNYNRKSYKSYVWYFKGVLEHKDIQIGSWTPNVSEYYNSGNIKDKIPQKFTKKHCCLVPVPSSRIPFMPKHVKSQQNLTCYIISKDKIIIESMIQNSGVPYSDCFNLRMKKVIETTSENSCSLTFYFYANIVTTTMMKNMIETRSAEQSKDVFIKHGNEVKKYLKYLQKIKSKSKDESTKQISSSVQTSQGSQEEIEEDIAQDSSGQEKAQKELKQLQIRMKQGKQILLGSLLLNIILIVLLIS